YLQEMALGLYKERHIGWPERLQRCKKIAAVIWFGLRMYARSVQARRALGTFVKQRFADQKKFYVIKTFSYNSSFNEQGQYRDAFFGRLPEDLSRSKNVLLFVNVL